MRSRCRAGRRSGRRAGCAASDARWRATRAGVRAAAVAALDVVAQVPAPPRGAGRLRELLADRPARDRARAGGRQQRLARLVDERLDLARRARRAPARPRRATARRARRAGAPRAGRPAASAGRPAARAGRRAARRPRRGSRPTAGSGRAAPGRRAARAGARRSGCARRCRAMPARTPAPGRPGTPCRRRGTCAGRRPRRRAPARACGARTTAARGGGARRAPRTPRVPAPGRARQLSVRPCPSWSRSARSSSAFRSTSNFPRSRASQSPNDQRDSRENDAQADPRRRTGALLPGVAAAAPSEPTAADLATGRVQDREARHGHEAVQEDLRRQEHGEGDERVHGEGGAGSGGGGRRTPPRPARPSATPTGGVRREVRHQQERQERVRQVRLGHDPSGDPGGGRGPRQRREDLQGGQARRRGRVRGGVREPPERVRQVRLGDGQGRRRRSARLGQLVRLPSGPRRAGIARRRVRRPPPISRRPRCSARRPCPSRRRSTTRRCSRGACSGT